MGVVGRDVLGRPGRTRGVGSSELPARAVTAVFSPTLLLAVLSPVIGGLAAGPAGIAWGLLGMVFTAGIPAVIVHVGVVRGVYTDHHLRRREERAVPLTLAALSVVAGALVLWLVGAPQPIVALQVAVLASLVVATVVTLRWKISFHLAVVSASAAALAVFGGGWWNLFWLAVPLCAWSRLRLRAHTPAQVVAGTVEGAVVTFLVLGWLA